ncbi:MAG TPA: hypothetical protein VNZ49_08995 [Bacteroidia bacterium]|nr:hypothetical protein [Bacteroidia bacterium]
MAMIIITYVVNPFRQGYRKREKEQKSFRHTIANETSQDERLIAKGVDFEKFIVTKFDRKYFKIHEWRGDKYVQGVYALSNKNPDLEIEYSHNGKSRKFAVECKYREGIYDEVIICKEHKIYDYKNFSKQKRMPVFIVLGLGGAPSSPMECYVIPIEDVNNEMMNYKRLQNYRKYSVNSNFFFDLQMLNLR